MTTTKFEQIKQSLVDEPHTWLITGVAGFIGSNLLEQLLKLNQRVVGLDNFSTGRQGNLNEVELLVSASQWKNFQFVHGDIRNLDDCTRSMKFSDPLDKNGQIPVEYVLHQAALGSVTRSIEDPISTNETNINGFLNILIAARDARVRQFVYAASSSTYGDHADLPKIESRIGRPLSPYAVTKYVNELYADVFSRIYDINTIGLRYFNVFGRRQDPNGAYAAVIPKWFANMISGDPVLINGDGETSRDFCYIENVIQANILAATEKNIDAVNNIYNIAFGERTSLNQLHEMLQHILQGKILNFKTATPIYQDFRAGDVRHSHADISKARELLGYRPSFSVGLGLNESSSWYISR